MYMYTKWNFIYYEKIYIYTIFIRLFITYIITDNVYNFMIYTLVFNNYYGTTPRINSKMFIYVLTGLSCVSSHIF